MNLKLIAVLQTFYTTRNSYHLFRMTTTKLGDEFLRIPKLDVSGSNWVLFKERFNWALDARGILDHTDGTGAEPVDPVSGKSREKGELTEKEKELEKEWKKEVKEWKQGKRCYSRLLVLFQTHFS